MNVITKENDEDKSEEDSEEVSDYDVYILSKVRAKIKVNVML